MTPENFCYWLRGFIEIQRPRGVDESQLEIIDDHLNLVFGKVTPKRTSGLLEDIKIVNGQSFNTVFSWPEGPPASC